MKISQKQKIAYAYSFVSYLFRKLDAEKIDHIRAIYLFGSTAQGTARPSSDIDIFIDTKKEFKFNVEQFYNSSEFKFFKKIGIDNPINLIIGNLNEWELKSSIERGSVILYGKYIVSKEEAYIFWWEPPKDNVNFHRKLFGYFGKNKRYKGLLEKIGGERIGKNTILVKNPSDVINLMKEFDVKFKMRRVFL